MSWHPKPASTPSGFISQFAPCRKLIKKKIEQGFTAQRIHEDLVSWTDSPLPMRRLETPPGYEAQIDFSMAAPVIVDGKHKQPLPFRIVLRCSRGGYSESVFPSDDRNLTAVRRARCDLMVFTQVSH